MQLLTNRRLPSKLHRRMTAACNYQSLKLVEILDATKRSQVCKQVHTHHYKSRATGIIQKHKKTHNSYSYHSSQSGFS
jgi:hypothetical protein